MEWISVGGSFKNSELRNSEKVFYKKYFIEFILILLDLSNACAGFQR